MADLTAKLSVFNVFLLDFVVTWQKTTDLVAGKTENTSLFETYCQKTDTKKVKKLSLFVSMYDAIVITLYSTLELINCMVDNIIIN